MPRRWYQVALHGLIPGLVFTVFEAAPPCSDSLCFGIMG